MNEKTLYDVMVDRAQEATADTIKSMRQEEEPLINLLRDSDTVDTSAIFDAVAVGFEGQRKAALEALSKTEAGKKCLAELARIDEQQHQAGRAAVARAVRKRMDPMGLLEIEPNHVLFNNSFIKLPKQYPNILTFRKHER